MKTRILGAIFVGVIVSLVVGFLSTPPSRAGGPVFLYWAAPHVRTGSLQTCYAFAKDVMRNAHAQNVRVSPNEVAGTIGGSYAAITCIATAPEATAVVMVTGSTGNETKQICDTLNQKMRGIVRFD